MLLLIHSFLYQIKYAVGALSISTNVELQINVSLLVGVVGFKTAAETHGTVFDIVTPEVFVLVVFAVPSPHQISVINVFALPTGGA